MTRDPNAATRAELRQMVKQAMLPILTAQYIPGEELTGVDAEIADMQDAEPYNLAVARIPQIRAEIVWDDRVGRSNNPAMAMALLASAANALPALLDEIDAARRFITKHEEHYGPICWRCQVLEERGYCGCEIAANE